MIKTAIPFSTQRPEISGTNNLFDVKDSYVKAVADKIDKKNGKVQNVTVGNTVYYVEVEPITGTDWVLVSNVKESTVLEDLKGLQTRIILILVLAMVINGFLIE